MPLFVVVIRYQSLIMIHHFSASVSAHASQCSEAEGLFWHLLTLDDLSSWPQEAGCSSDRKVVCPGWSWFNLTCFINYLEDLEAVPNPGAYSVALTGGDLNPDPVLEVIRTESTVQALCCQTRKSEVHYSAKRSSGPRFYRPGPMRSAALRPMTCWMRISALFLRQTWETKMEPSKTRRGKQVVASTQ